MSMSAMMRSVLRTRREEFVGKALGLLRDGANPLAVAIFVLWWVEGVPLGFAFGFVDEAIARLRGEAHAVA